MYCVNVQSLQCNFGRVCIQTLVTCIQPFYYHARKLKDKRLLHQLDPNVNAHTNNNLTKQRHTYVV